MFINYAGVQTKQEVILVSDSSDEFDDEPLSRRYLKKRSAATGMIHGGMPDVFVNENCSGECGRIFRHHIDLEKYRVKADFHSMENAARSTFYARFLLNCVH